MEIRLIDESIRFPIWFYLFLHIRPLPRGGASRQMKQKWNSTPLEQHIQFQCEKLVFALVAASVHWLTIYRLNFIGKRFVLFCVSLLLLVVSESVCRVPPRFNAIERAQSVRLTHGLVHFKQRPIARHLYDMAVVFWRWPRTHWQWHWVNQRDNPPPISGWMGLANIR